MAVLLRIAPRRCLGDKTDTSLVAGHARPLVRTRTRVVPMRGTLANTNRKMNLRWRNSSHDTDLTGDMDIFWRVSICFTTAKHGTPTIVIGQI